MWIVIIKYVGSAAISGLVAWVVAKLSAKAEINRLRETWAHDREEAINTNFAEMSAAVSAFLRNPSAGDYINAAKTIGLCRADATGDLAEALDALWEEMSKKPINMRRIEEKLNCIIALKRTG